ncbi:aromatic amino acid lyase [Neolewinella persica]|uniref:aromatic amino acid lyase n=1 Tax=Neolewinella persica TaxID=70998 RepID=UPI00035D0B7F|nr:aromatic amino acid lyase [Neolewinella persica]
MEQPLYVQLINHVLAGTAPEYFYEARSRIRAERSHLGQLIEQGERIYAVNSLTGHKDDVVLSPEEMEDFQEILINNHHLPSVSFFDGFTGRCIAYLKTHQVALGYTGISEELYDVLLGAIAAPDFQPAIPKDASYSSGDVIPGAYLAKELLNFAEREKLDFRLRPKDGISLLNGNFVHLGSALALVPELKSHWLLSMASAVSNASLCQANDTNYLSPFSKDANDPILAVATAFKQEGRRPVQDPVSLRCMPQNLTAFYRGLEHWYGALEMELHRYSDNPLIVPGFDFAISQGSFVATDLSLATGQIIENLLLLAWQVCERNKYLLSGKVAGVPEDAAIGASDLGLIQVPKLMQATLESMRMQLGRRTFASGSQTSGGTEDFWSYGTLLNQQLTAGLEFYRRILNLEGATHLYVAANLGRPGFYTADQFNPGEKITFTQAYDHFTGLTQSEISDWQKSHWQFPEPQ